MQRRTAFTLVELLVVIGIIALLISILLPALSKARQQANLVACSAQLRDFGNALQMYTVANKGSFPGPCYGAFSVAYTYPDGKDGKNSLPDFLWSYLKLPPPTDGPRVMKNLICPGYLSQSSGTVPPNDFYTYHTFCYDPYPWLGYPKSANSTTWFPKRCAELGLPTSGAVMLPPMKISQVYKAAEMPIIADMDKGFIVYNEGVNPADVSQDFLDTPNHGGKSEKRRGMQGPTGGVWNATSLYPKIYDPKAATNAPRNVLYLDGHVATVRSSSYPLPPRK